jgi:3-oxoadipate enol-lactonase
MASFVQVPGGRIRIDRRVPQNDGGRPPLVLLGGMTQTIHSWGGQLRPLSRTREVIAYEARGQGATDLDVADCSLPRHVEDFANLLDALDLAGAVDLCGFSFGGRVSLAIAATRPDRVRRLVLSGVGLGRGIVGQLIVQAWIASLATGDLDALARISLPDILGPTYLEAHAHLVPSMVKTAVDRNRYEAITALFRDTMGHDVDAAWSVAALAEKVPGATLVMGGALDRLAPPAEVEALAGALGGQHRTFPDAGHTIPIEAAGPWRAAVETFLDEA